MSTIEFTSLIVGNTEFLKPFAFTLTRDNEEARDLLQETMFRAFANKEKYNFGTNIKAWLYTIMRNIFINAYRKKSRENVVYNYSINDFLLDHNQHTVSNNAESRLKIKEIQTAIHHLPDIFRNPFLLYFDGYKYYEIADILQEPLGTIKSRIHFARKLLKERVNRF